MHCNQCGASNPDGAKFCGSCGLELGGRVTSAKPEGKKDDLTSKQATSGCLAIVGVGVLIYLLADCGGPEQQSGADSVRPIENVTAEQLVAAYEENEAAAQQRFGDKRIIVTGTVASIDLDFADDPVIVLSGDRTNQFKRVQAALADDAKSTAGNYSKGQTVALTCEEISEVIGTPMLKDCRSN